MQRATSAYGLEQPKRVPPVHQCAATELLTEEIVSRDERKALTDTAKTLQTNRRRPSVLRSSDKVAIVVSSGCLAELT